MEAEKKQDESSFLCDQRGSILPLVAVGMVVIIGAAAVAVDMPHLYEVKGKLQATADVSALAAASNLSVDESTIISSAVSYAEKNMPIAANGTVLASSDVVLGHWDDATREFIAMGSSGTPGKACSNPVPQEKNKNCLSIDAVKVTTRRTEAGGNPAPTYFAQVLGIAPASVTAEAIAVMRTSKELDVVIVQDVTTSFKKELGDAKVADQILLDCIKNSANGESKVGLVMYTGFGTVLEPPSDNPPLRTVDEAYSEMTDAISKIKKCGKSGMPPCSGTHIAAGLIEANRLFAGTPPGPNNLRQAIVVVSDGKSNASSKAQPYDGSCKKPTKCTNSELEAMAVAAADAAWADGVHVYTVFYGEDDDDDDDDAAFLASLVRGDGKAYKTPIPTELANLMFKVCTENIPLRLVR